jgi:hypothetical protein
MLTTRSTRRGWLPIGDSTPCSLPAARTRPSSGFGSDCSTRPNCTGTGPHAVPAHGATSVPSTPTYLPPHSQETLPAALCCCSSTCAPPPNSSSKVQTPSSPRPHRPVPNVWAGGLEPPRVSSLDPKSSASAIPPRPRDPPSLADQRCACRLRLVLAGGALSFCEQHGHHGHGVFDFTG